jgi:guanyl-specific ribonuclease Sa
MGLLTRALFAGLILLFAPFGYGEGPRPPLAQPPATVRLDALPPEARVTLELIHRGGPFPYWRDGAVFSNRERRLPARPRGWYREYTVPTPGSRDRGARRIVAGGGEEFYWTADHYTSFRRIEDAGR